MWYLKAIVVSVILVCVRGQSIKDLIAAEKECEKQYPSITMGT